MKTAFSSGADWGVAPFPVIVASAGLFSSSDASLADRENARTESSEGALTGAPLRPMTCAGSAVQVAGDEDRAAATSDATVRLRRKFLTRTSWYQLSFQADHGGWTKRPTLCFSS
jgi:hypothetical protein